VHGIFVFVFFGLTSSSSGLFSGIGLRGVAIVAAALFLSHGVSFFADSLGAPLAALILLVLLKTVIDLLAHLREHRKAEMRSGPAAAAGG